MIFEIAKNVKTDKEIIIFLAHGPGGYFLFIRGPGQA